VFAWCHAGPGARVAPLLWREPFAALLLLILTLPWRPRIGTRARGTPFTCDARRLRSSKPSRTKSAHAATIGEVGAELFHELVVEAENQQRSAHCPTKTLT
jgi:hypothetical protein